MTQTKVIPFKNGMPGKTWLKWFRNRHHDLVLRVPQGLDMNRATTLCLGTVENFYSNLETLYQTHHYELDEIWNCFEIRAHANRNGEGAMLAKRGTRVVHTMALNERIWTSILVAINSTSETMPNYYVFKGKRPRQDYMRLCEDGACIGMQESWYMDTLNFSKWMSLFLNYHERMKFFSPTKRFLLVLDGHKSHISLQVLLKAKEHGVDMVSLSSHTSHALQPLDIACFKPFKQSFRIYRDM